MFSRALLDSQKCYGDEKLKSLEDFTRFLKKAETSETSAELQNMLEVINKNWLSDLYISDSTAEALFGGLAGSPLPEVRAWAADKIQSHLPSRWARDIICGLSVDPDDIVCMTAMRVAGNHDLKELAPYFLEIIGKPSDSISTSVCPVGRGASIVRSALIQLLRAEPTDRSALQEAENNLLSKTPVIKLSRDEESLDLHNRFDYESANRWLKNQLLNRKNMQFIPGGLYRVGLSSSQVPVKVFAWERCVPSFIVWTPPFLIDQSPVVNKKYDQWVKTSDHTSCHPLEPAGHVHRRNTYLDERVGPTHPATGVDWFDAEGYARHIGNTLPNHLQWEIAARGKMSSIWPWGDSWDPSKVHYFNSSFKENEVNDISSWRKVLEKVKDRSWPATSTASVDREEAFINDFGLVDMSGNCWEWTSSELRTRGPFSPTISRFLPETTSVILKGGCWSSMEGQLYPSFIGQDAPFCRHDEIGFRTVFNIPRALLRSFLGFNQNNPLPSYLY